MAHIPYVPLDDIPAEDRVDDTDHILRIHGVHSRVMRVHFDLYIELMRKTGPLTRVQREMLAFAVKLARPHAGMTAADVESLRSSGFGVRAIHDICAIVAYFAFVNRIADGLGAELEPRFGA